ncbi:acyl-CoA reductase [Dokdonella sp.]|uniref:acyl-CoA reductase n=1 Tax=Dokdonella sp. TaxID=2291710 RepID=UPI0031C70CD3|nr:AMP-binding protein [Dokdonella sp.]
MNWQTPDPATPHLWQGAWLDDAGLDARLARLGDELHADLARPVPLAALLRACQALASRLGEGDDQDTRLVAALTTTLRQDQATGADEARATLATLAEHLSRTALETKLRRELGSLAPHTPRRIDGTDDAFEAWAPLGLLVHVAPGNVPTVAPLSVIEGLLAGNLNILKASSGVPPFAQQLLAALIALDDSGTLAPFISVVALPSSDTARLEALFAVADGVAAWGGEAAVAAVQELAPAGCRVVDWGHKISFAWLAAECLADEAVLEAAARDACIIEQQACSSPQCLYVEVPDRAALFAFAEHFAGVLARVSATLPRAAGAEPGQHEWADITTAALLAQLEEDYSGATRSFVAPDRSWRVFAEDNPALRASPLFRTLWIKPLAADRIVDTLRPMRRWLQTAGLACSLPRLAELSQRLIAAGVGRIARVGEQLGGYVGAPHDGVYALQRYSRRVSLELTTEAQGISSFDELRVPASPLRPGTPLLDKAGFLALAGDPSRAELVFRSGGSSGEPKMSVFSWEDYHTQMRAAADGLRAAGLDPARDRCMNLFFAGHLYGGFVSFWSILEALGARQLPMAGIDDLGEVATTIVARKVDTLLGMPFYINRLFTEQADVLRAYRGVRKVFFGGEHMAEPLRARLRDEFGVQLIRAASYGSNDAGPLGYQCAHCEGAVYHVLTQTQYLEILDADADRPAPPGVPGRLVFTSLQRASVPVERYEIGDMGRWLAEPCPCGRAAPRFELLGRYGDLFRAPAFFNYSRFVRTLAEQGAYAGPVQLELSHDGTRHRIRVRVLEGEAPPAEILRALLLAHDPDLHHFVEHGEALTGLDIELAPLERFVALPVTGKLKSIVDLRGA